MKNRQPHRHFIASTATGCQLKVGRGVSYRDKLLQAHGLQSVGLGLFRFKKDHYIPPLTTNNIPAE
jgi:hypothetical protein